MTLKHAGSSVVRLRPAREISTYESTILIEKLGEDDEQRPLPTTELEIEDLILDLALAAAAKLSPEELAKGYVIVEVPEFFNLPRIEGGHSL